MIAISYRRVFTDDAEVQFFQLGNDGRAREFLQVLERGSTKKPGEGGEVARRTTYHG